MNWTIDDIWTYMSVHLLSANGKGVIYRRENLYFVVRYWNKNKKEMFKRKPILVCQDAECLIEWLTRMGYEYR